MITPVKKKLLILYNSLFHYRISIFNILAKEYDLTVVYSLKTTTEILESCNFKTIYYPIINICNFTLYKKNNYDFYNNFDIVIAYGDPKWISISSLLFYKKRKFKLFFWTIGVGASYKRKFGDAGLMYYILLDFFLKKADGLILYSNIAKQMCVSRGYKEHKLFVANNTVQVKKIDFNPSSKKHIIFIGSLYFEKGLNILLNAYMEAYKIDNSIPLLKIIGNGDEYEKILNWIKEKNLNNQIYLLGSIYDEEKKSDIMKEALVCISPLQAGLSVLECMGYGVPFVTLKDAITGGEAFNIKHQYSGLRLNSPNNFKDIILDLNLNKAKYIEYGAKAYEFYWGNRTPEHMVSGICSAINNHI